MSADFSSFVFSSSLLLEFVVVWPLDSDSDLLLLRACLVLEALQRPKEMEFLSCCSRGMAE